MTRAIPPVLLVGAGRMGGALFAGWCRAGLAPSMIVDPATPSGLAREADRLLRSLEELPPGFVPEAVLLAVKPQMASAVLPGLRPHLRPATPVISIVAGLRRGTIAAALDKPQVIRAMPNTPAAIGQGMTVCCAGAEVGPAARALADRLMAAVGAVAWVADEHQIDTVTAVSGSGPAYVFLLAELLEQAARDHGLPPGLARQIARQTITGAGAMLAAAPEDAATLRHHVTSPAGTTTSALAVLMAPDAWPRAVPAAIEAAVARARELGG